jgi:hypothetical protein
MDLFEPVMKVFAAMGVQPWMYEILIGFGVVHQYLKGMVRWWTPALSVASAGVLSLGFGVLAVIENHTKPTAAAAAFVSMFAAGLVTEGLMEVAAQKLPFVPKNNAWVTPAVPAPAPAPTDAVPVPNPKESA